MKMKYLKRLIVITIGFGGLWLIGIQTASASDFGGYFGGGYYRFGHRHYLPPHRGSNFERDRFRRHSFQRYRRPNIRRYCENRYDRHPAAYRNGYGRSYQYYRGGGYYR